MTTTAAAQWTRDDLLAYEVAVECIGHVMAFVSAELFGPSSAALSEDRADALKGKLADLAGERQHLHVGDAEHIAAIREQYGAIVRTFAQDMNRPVNLDAIVLR